MKQRWSLYFENLGRVDQGKVALAPLMLFTGQNNTGKSYVMSLLWGVIALGRDLFPEDVPENAAYQRCDEWLISRVGEETALDDTTANLFVAWYSEVLNHNRQKLTDLVFGVGRVKLKALRISDYSRKSSLKLKWDQARLDVVSRFSSGTDYVRFPTEGSEISKAARYRMIRYLTWKLLMGELSAPLFPPQQPLNPIPRGEILYLPAARTGFMLMRKTLAAATMGLASLQGGDPLPLVLPARRFVQRLLGLEYTGNGKYASIAELIEEQVIQGNISPDNAPLPDYQYRPASQTDLALPIWLTSSMVTELAPLLIFLRSKEDYRTLLIEEPEAHLHPEVQIILAKALVRLVNAGLPVWLTTHGDNFFQQLSNLVKASSLTKAQQEEYGLMPEDCIKPTDMSGWHFSLVGEGKRQRTSLIPLEIGIDGISGRSFNETLIQLQEQTISLNEEIECKE